jgi:hypothetical protein
MSQDLSDYLDIEDLWDALLSRQAERVRAAFGSLDIEHQHAVSAHLQRMASEDDWHPEQRLSAQAALAALENLP